MMNKRALGATLLVAAALLQPSFANYADELNARFIRHKKLARRRLVGPKTSRAAKAASTTDHLEEIRRGRAKLRPATGHRKVKKHEVSKTTVKWQGKINGRYYKNLSELSYHNIKQLISKLKKKIYQTSMTTASLSLRYYHSQYTDHRSWAKSKEMAEIQKVAESELEILKKIIKPKRKEMRDENLATLLRTASPFNKADALPKPGDKIRMIVDRPEDIIRKSIKGYEYHYKPTEVTVRENPPGSGKAYSYPKYPTLSFSKFNKYDEDMYFHFKPDNRQWHPYLSEDQVRELKLRKVVKENDTWVFPNVCGSFGHKMYSEAS